MLAGSACLSGLRCYAKRYQYPFHLFIRHQTVRIGTAGRRWKSTAAVVKSSVMTISDISFNVIENCYDYDAVVVGAGPAGSTTAAEIAQGGFRVLLLEEHAEIGIPLHCSGLVTPRTLDEAGV